MLALWLPRKGAGVILRQLMLPGKPMPSHGKRLWVIRSPFVFCCFLYFASSPPAPLVVISYLHFVPAIVVLYPLLAHVVLVIII